VTVSDINTNPVKINVDAPAQNTVDVSTLSSEEKIAYYHDLVEKAESNLADVEQRYELNVKDANNKIAEAEADVARDPDDATKQQTLQDAKDNLDEIIKEGDSELAKAQEELDSAKEEENKAIEDYKREQEEANNPTPTLDSTPVAQPQVDTVSVPTSSTVNATGTAQRDALRNQMFSMRDRVANLGRTHVAPTSQQQYWVQPSKDGSVPGHFVKSKASATATDVNYHLWVEGNGGYTDLDEQSGRGGYRLKTWGGTVGAAALLDNDLTLGAAFSAQWGDLTSSGGQEWASGDLDSLYLHLFGHYQSNAWGHTLILTGTTTDATLNRSGFFDGEYFNTHGDTDGYGFGALYELTYDIPLNDAGTTLLQPLFDVSIVHTQLDAYNETGTKALHVGKQEWTTGSVALGARLSGTFGSESLGHPFFGEVRASVSQDFGDTRGKTSIAWADNPGVSNTAYGSKVGATAVQVGAGISTPLTSYSTLYANVGADFRQRENSVGGAVGLRFSF
jgi:hypothetical protein